MKNKKSMKELLFEKKYGNALYKAFSRSDDNGDVWIEVVKVYSIEGSSEYMSVVMLSEKDLSERWRGVRWSSKHPYAFPTKEEALMDLWRKKEIRIRITETQTRLAKSAISKIKDELKALRASKKESGNGERKKAK